MARNGEFGKPYKDTIQLNTFYAPNINTQDNMCIQTHQTYNQHVGNGQQSLGTAMKPIAIGQTGAVDALANDTTGNGRKHK